MKMSSKLVYQYMAIFFNFSPTSNHLHPLQVENCDSNSRLVVDEDDKVKLGLKGLITSMYLYKVRPLRVGLSSHDFNLPMPVFFTLTEP